MSTLPNLTIDSGSFGSPINLVLNTTEQSLPAPETGQLLFVVVADQYTFTSGADSLTFLRFRLYKRTSAFTVSPNIYYWSQYVPISNGGRACMGFFNAMTNHVDQWLYDESPDNNPVTIYVNPRFGDYSAIVPAFYEDEDEPIDP